MIVRLTLRTYPNQKPWITGNNRTEQKARAAAFQERDTNLDAYKKSRYDLQRAIKLSTHQCGTIVEFYYAGSDTHQMWQGLQTLDTHQMWQGLQTLVRCVWASKFLSTKLYVIFKVQG